MMDADRKLVEQRLRCLWKRGDGDPACSSKLIFSTVDRSIFVDHQPGNGTRYPLLFTPIPVEPAIYEALGLSTSFPSWTVLWATTFRFLIFGESEVGPITFGYVGQKLCGRAPASPEGMSEIAKVVGAVLGRTALVCTDRFGFSDRDIFDEWMRTPDGERQELAGPRSRGERG